MQMILNLLDTFSVIPNTIPELCISKSAFFRNKNNLKFIWKNNKEKFKNNDE